ncbi:MAG TPA: hypothetical protein VE054_11805, partial [Blattabacteriaceae bacterium]|nr:hypothetical protein [Blattabacteriaceae bacterium]
WRLRKNSRGCRLFFAALKPLEVRFRIEMFSAPEADSSPRKLGSLSNYLSLLQTTWGVARNY